MYKASAANQGIHNFASESTIPGIQIRKNEFKHEIVERASYLVQGATQAKGICDRLRNYMRQKSAVYYKFAGGFPIEDMSLCDGCMVLRSADNHSVMVHQPIESVRYRRAYSTARKQTTLGYSCNRRNAWLAKHTIPDHYLKVMKCHLCGHVQKELIQPPEEKPIAPIPVEPEVESEPEVLPLTKSQKKKAKRKRKLLEPDSPQLGDALRPKKSKEAKSSKEKTPAGDSETNKTNDVISTKSNNTHKLVISKQTSTVKQQTPAKNKQTPAINKQTPAINRQTPTVNRQTPPTKKQTPSLATPSLTLPPGVVAKSKSAKKKKLNILQKMLAEDEQSKNSTNLLEMFIKR